MLAKVWKWMEKSFALLSSCKTKTGKKGSFLPASFVINFCWDLFHQTSNSIFSFLVKTIIFHKQRHILSVKESLMETGENLVFLDDWITSPHTSNFHIPREFGILVLFFSLLEQEFLLSASWEKKNADCNASKSFLQFGDGQNIRFRESYRQSTIPLLLSIQWTLRCYSNKPHNSRGSRPLLTANFCFKSGATHSELYRLRNHFLRTQKRAAKIQASALLNVICSENFFVLIQIFFPLTA